jgi:hypothetical protein
VQGRHQKRHSWTSCLALMVCSLFFVSCLPGLLSDADENKRLVLAQSNDPASLSPGHGRVLTDNPFILSGNNKNLSASIPLSNFILAEQNFITTGQFLEKTCQAPDASHTTGECLEVLKDAATSPLTQNNGTWGYHPDNLRFLEPHGFFHLKNVIDQFLSWGQNAYGNAFTLGGPFYNTAVPSTYFSDGGYWYDSELKSYMSCELVGNAFYRSSTNTLCFGIDPDFLGLAFAQDPTVIFHEMGHALVKIMLNSRNRVNATVLADTSLRSEMGVLFYDEAGAINEGIADYLSFAMNQRTHMGEWALGSFYQASRPMAESDPLHVSGLSESNDERLRYPHYLTYEPRFPELHIEDVHNAGMITSHFLVALTKLFQSQCSDNHTQSVNKVMYLLIETLAELGDLTAKGSDVAPYGVTDNINLTLTNDGGENPSKDWTEYIHPVNYRRFYQVLAKHFLDIFTGSSSLCQGSAMTQDHIEELLDSYGLLLFKTFNNDGNGYNAGVATGHVGTPIAVNASNRINSLLLKKDKLILDPEQNATQAFVFDQQSDIQNLVASLLTSGQVTDFSTLIPSDVVYNNGNGQISPGEIVGLALNLYNDSNAPIGGAHVLANPWDHGKLESDGSIKPCPINGIGDASADSSPAVVGDCGYVTKMNGTDEDGLGDQAEFLMPTCMALLQEENQTRWVFQEELMDHIGLESNQCLKGSTKPNECLLRVLPGADHAFYSRIEGNKTWGETVINNGDVEFQTHNILVMEVSPFTPPGTQFTCRFRVRFTNCDDCWHDSAQGGDDFLDFKYAGTEPYNVIQFNFTVLD